MAEPKVQVNVRLSPGLHGRLTAEASRSGRTVTDVVAEAVDDYLKIITPRGKGKAA